MKKIICLLLVLGVTLCSLVVFGAEAPEVPDVADLDPEAANEVIEAYNESVEEYNATVDEEYEAAVAEVEAHNAEVDEAIAENEAALQEQEQLQAIIESDAERGITENRTDAFEDLPTTWEEEPSEELKTIVVEETGESEETYQVINIHLYMDEEYSQGTSEGSLQADQPTIDGNENFVFDDVTKEHVVLAEWESTEARVDDTVTTMSTARAMGYSSAAFYKRFEGYTNGYWIPDGDYFASTAVNEEWNWLSGTAHTFSYADGTTDRQAPTNVLSIYFYSFVRRGAEPIKVEPIEPDYWDAPEKGEYLEKMELIEIPQPEPEPEPQPEPEPEPIVEPIVEPEPEPTPEPQEEEEIIPPAPAPVEEQVPAPMPVTPMRYTPPVQEEEVMEPQEPVREVTTVTHETTSIEEIPIPLANPVVEKDGKGWALVNLILVITTALALLKFSEKKYNIPAIILPVASILLFVFTENTENPMIWVDKWTIWMVAIYVVELICRLVGKKDQKEEESAEKSK